MYVKFPPVTFFFFGLFLPGSYEQQIERLNDGPFEYRALHSLYLRDNGLTEIPSIILRTITHLTSIHLSGYVQNPALFTGNRVC